MQSMVATVFRHEGETFNGYVYVNENGEETYFKESEKQGGENTLVYALYESVEDDEMLYDPYKRTLTVGGETCEFDAYGRLIALTDEYGNCMTVTYTADRISSVTDGAGREFTFAYNALGELTAITAPDNTVISYSYTNNLLTGIVHPDGRETKLTYSADKPNTVVLTDSAGKNVYRGTYTLRAIG